MKTVLGYLRPHAGRVAAGAAIKFTAAVLELILPLLLAEVIDELVPAGDTAAIWRTGGRMAAWVSMEMTRVLRQDLYRRIQGLSCTQADQFSPSSLVSRLTNDTYNVHQMFDKVQRGGIRAPMLVLGGLILTFLLEPSLALVQLAVSLLTFLTITLVTRRGIPHYTRAQAAVDTVVRILRENAAGVRVVKALACQVRERDRFDTANQAQRQAEAQRELGAAALAHGAQQVFPLFQHRDALAPQPRRAWRGTCIPHRQRDPGQGRCPGQKCVEFLQHGSPPISKPSPFG